MRGITVGGHNKPSIAELRQNYANALGWSEAATYVASGNLVFRATGDAAQLANTLRTTQKITEMLTS